MLEEITNEPRLRLNGEFKVLTATLTLICAIGWGMMTSASSANGARSWGDSWYYSKRQLAAIAVGIILAWAISRLHVKIIRLLSLPALLATVALLVLVLKQGHNVYGQQNWIALPLGFNLQPSELAKFTLILSAAAWIRFCAKYGFNLRLRIAGIALMTLAVVVLVLMEKDFGNPVIILAIGVAIITVAGAPMRWLWWFIGLGVAALAVVFATGGLYRLDRITAWLHPEQDASGGGYQLLHGKFALADGGWLGLGIGQSTEKWGALPQPHTDFILPIIAQELGVVGTGLVMVLLITLIAVAFHIADHSHDYYDRIVAFGIATWLTVQTIVNVGGVTQLLPITGVPLPFVSYGGTSIVLLMAAMGVLLGIARNNSAQVDEV